MEATGRRGALRGEPQRQINHDDSETVRTTVTTAAAAAVTTVVDDEDDLAAAANSDSRGWPDARGRLLNRLSPEKVRAMKAAVFVFPHCFPRWLRFGTDNLEAALLDLLLIIQQQQQQQQQQQHCCS